MKKISVSTLDAGIKSSLIPYLSILFILTALGSWQAFLTHSTWHMGDWLINYQGGFVRRGFLGEVIYQLATYTTINPGFYVFLIQVFLNGCFLFCSFLLLRKQKTLLPYLLLIFSPFLFMFQINSFDQIESQGGYFKESIYCCLIAVVGWSAVAYEEKKFTALFYVILLFYPLAILTHEAFAIFLPMLLIIYLAKIELNTKRCLIIMGLLSLSLVSFVLSLIFSGDKTQVLAIYNSLLPQYPVSTYGSIGWLMMPLQTAIKRVLLQINYSHYFRNYSLIILLSLLAFIPVFRQLTFIFKNKISCLLFLLSLAGTVCLCCIAIDWGRFIRIILVTLFIFSLVAGPLMNEENKTINKDVSALFIVLSLGFILSYALLWRIPNCCNYRPPISGFKNNNLRWSYQPYKKIIHALIQTINKV